MRATGGMHWPTIGRNRNYPDDVSRPHLHSAERFEPLDRPFIVQTQTERIIECRATADVEKNYRFAFTLIERQNRRDRLRLGETQ